MFPRFYSLIYGTRRPPTVEEPTEPTDDVRVTDEGDTRVTDEGDIRITVD